MIRSQRAVEWSIASLKMAARIKRNGCCTDTSALPPLGFEIVMDLKKFHDSFGPQT